MAIADNKVVTFKDLYGANSMASFSDVTSVQIELPFFRGRVTPNSTIGALGNKQYSYEQYTKRLKYLYYGYAFYGDSRSPSNPFTTNSGSVGKPIYINSNGTSYSSFDIMVPLWHTNDTTAYNSASQELIMDSLRMSMISPDGQFRASFINYSAISSLADEDMVNDIWMEYKPIVKTDPSTGEPMKDENGNLLYETDEEGNVLYEEGDYYAETRRADEGILPL